MNLKLDTKKTIKVGFAFAIICLFWSLYDYVVPLLLDSAFGLNNKMRGLIMGLDNLFALFMLPLFGKLSDKSHSKHGRRTPFIVVGSIVSIVLMILIPVTSVGQLNRSYDVRNKIAADFNTDTAYRQQLLASWYDDTTNNYVDRELLTKDGVSKEEFVAITRTSLKVEGKKEDAKYYVSYGEAYSQVEKAEYDSVKKDLDNKNSNFNTYVSSGLSNYTTDAVRLAYTQSGSHSLVFFMVALLLVLIAMGTFRSPAVALMPDVTPKPLRSQANAIINLAGGVGGAIAVIIYTVVFLVDGSRSGTSFFLIYVLGAIGMAALLLAFIKMVNEPKLLAEKEAICLEYGIAEDEGFSDLEEQMEEGNLSGLEVEEYIAEEKTVSSANIEENKKLEKAKFKSFLLILASIFMWFMGYNAVTSNLSIYITKTLGLEAGLGAVISMASQGISAIAFIPVGMLAVKIGRKKSIVIGFALAVLSYLLIWLFIYQPGGAVGFGFALFYLLAGFGLIIANVNTFPMVVELSKADDVGKYTGFYYMATMSAQTVTPYLAGVFMDISNNDRILFLYSAIWVVGAIVLMCLVKHGDSKPLPSKKSKLEQYGDLSDAD